MVTNFLKKWTQNLEWTVLTADIHGFRYNLKTGAPEYRPGHQILTLEFPILKWQNSQIECQLTPFFNML
jgi:expansin (peptidoglycan-binding protein)